MTMNEKLEEREVKLKGIIPRIYQENIFAKAVQRNTLVVLPTGLGKTAIALMLMVHRLRQYPSMKVLMISPTRPLCQQHYNTIKKHIDIDEDKIKLFTGNLRQEKRKKEWEEAKIIVATPQTIEASLLGGDISLRDVSLLVIDEAHRAIGNYSYVGIAKNYMKNSKRPRILALTASPGSDMEKVREVVKNLYIEEIEVRTTNDPDVKPYVKEVEIEWIGVDLSKEMKELQEIIKKAIKKRIDELKEKNIRISSRPSKKDLLALQATISKKLGEEFSYSGAWMASMIAEVIKLNYALELLESQGVIPLYKYLRKIILESEHRKSKASSNIAESSEFKELLIKTEELMRKEEKHPKIEKLIEEVRRINGRIIIFTQYRDTAVMIQKELEKNNISSKIFVGQQKKGFTGLSQKEQKKIIEEFTNNEFKCLISTSIGEEGLDIPEVELVLFYEPIPSIIRYIQRKGRTGRHKEGRVVILYSKKTIDEAYRWTLYHKKREMFRAIKRLNTELKKEATLTLKDFLREEKKEREKPIEIIIDYREKSNAVVKHLLKENISIKFANLSVGDFMIGPVVIEFKTVIDFVASIIDKRLLDQVKRLSKTEKPLIIIQGEEDIYSVRNIHKNAINGMISSIVVDYDIPLLWFKNPKETASFLYSLAKRFQGEKRDINLHVKKPSTLKEQQEYLIASIPGIGSMLAKNLLKRFKTIKAIANADIKEIEQVEGIGKKKAETIKAILEKEWEEN